MKIGILGLGYMGATHLAALSGSRSVQVTAVCARNEASLQGDLTAVAGNVVSAAHRYDFSAIARYRRWQDLVSDPGVDAVDICLPSDLHVSVALAALAAGKHVLLEKPMALTTADCDALGAARLQANRILMVAHVLRFWPEYERLGAFIHAWGRETVSAARLSRRCGVPQWSSWLTDESRSGGALLDLLIHDLDTILHQFGKPASVRARMAGGVDTVEAQLHYPWGLHVGLSGGWLAAGVNFEMSFSVCTPHGGLRLEPSGVLKRRLPSGEWEQETVAAVNPYQREIEYFATCCRTGAEPVACHPRDSADAVKLALLLRESRSKGGKQIPCEI